jgi:hypothetical protein
MDYGNYAKYQMTMMIHKGKKEKKVSRFGGRKLD